MISGTAVGSWNVKVWPPSKTRSTAPGTNPRTGEAHDDLEMARTMISMIEVLKTKTKGNLARDEERALDEILYQLRMEFTRRAKSAKI